MQRRTLIRHALAGTLLAAAGQPAVRAEAAAPRALGFDLPGRDGPVRLADLRGMVVFLDFWASWCAPCKLSFPWMNQMQVKYGPQGLRVVAVSVDARRADAEKFLASMPVEFTVAFDPAGDTPRAYAIRAMPSSFLIGTDGRVLHSHAGFRDADKPDLEQRIRAALARA